MFFRILVQRTSVNVMVLTVIVLSVERYLAICHPFLVSKHHLSSPMRAIKIILINWIVGLSFALPFAYRFGLSKNMCRMIFSRKFSFVPRLMTIIFFFIPMLVISTMYVLIGVKLRKSTRVIKSVNETGKNLKQKAPKMISKDNFERICFIFKPMLKLSMYSF